MSDTNGFKQWCIVELFGHSVIAGLVGEQQIGGSSFVRVDVPATDGREAYTKLYGPGAIYAITPVDEDTCKRAVANLTQPPVDLWRFRPTVQSLPPRDGQDWEGDDDL